MFYPHSSILHRNDPVPLVGWWCVPVVRVQLKHSLSVPPLASNLRSTGRSSVDSIVFPGWRARGHNRWKVGYCLSVRLGRYRPILNRVGAIRYTPPSADGHLPICHDGVHAHIRTSDGEYSELVVGNRAGVPPWFIFSAVSLCTQLLRGVGYVEPAASYCGCEHPGRPGASR